MICVVCGRENPNYAVVCEQCGNFLPREEDLYGRLDNSEKLLAEATKELMEEQPSCSEVPEAVSVPEYVTPVANPVPKNRLRCRSCGKDNERTASYCEFCGMKLPQPKRREGGEADYQIFKELRDSTIHCVACGAEVPWSSSTCPVCKLNPRVGKMPNDTVAVLKETLYDYLLENGASNDILAENDILYKFFFKEYEQTLREERIKAEEEKRKIEDSKLRGSSILPPGARRCRSCGLINRAGTAFCAGCEAPLGPEPRRAADDALRRKAEAVMQQKECTCGFVNGPSVTVCARCGGIVKHKCPHCGYANLPKVTICANCGARLMTPQKPKL